MAEAPLCRKCDTHHWRFVKCVEAAEQEQSRVKPFIVHRPREGFLDYGDRLEPETVRMGESTFARRREPGERPGSFRAA